MKSATIGSSALPIVAAFSSLASAASFENTAPLLISSKLLLNSDIISPEYINTFSNVKENVRELTESLCSNAERITVIRFSGLDESNVSDDFLNEFYLSNAFDHVVYQSKEDSTDSSSLLGESCSGLANVLSVSSYDELKSAAVDDNLIIQGLPTFKAPSDSIMEQAALKFSNVLKTDKNNDKREDNIDYDEVEKELEDAFSEINNMLDDELVTIYNEENTFTKTAQVSSNSKKNQTVVDGSLFDKYGFFSTGIWMGTIVLLFLAWLLSIALGWLNSMQISYGAFEKPFDFEKKLQ